MQEDSDAKRWFILLWLAVLLLKAVLAWHVPLFVDEAFYWQEGQHPALAYSDLPGLTAWLTRAGVEAFGHSLFGLRLPFLLLAALLPWWVVRMARRVVTAREAWLAGSLSLLLPLTGALGLLALPDVPLAFATVLCLDAGLRLLRGVTAASAWQLAFGLAIGALTHYRFVAVIGVGFVALLLLPQGRRALRDWRVWLAVIAGAAAWWPLLSWNMANADAGLRFQMVDRHPWAFHADGVLFVLVQCLFATPLLFVAMLWAAWRDKTSQSAPGQRYLAWCGLLVLTGFFALGFFADNERVSFHWTVPGYLALLPLVPAWLARWRPTLRMAAWGFAAIGLVLQIGYYAMVASPGLRARLADEKWYPSNFAGWEVLASEVAAMRSRMPAGTVVVADNFKIGAELGFALRDARIPVLDHPLNHKHGRAPQLRIWGLQPESPAALSGKPLLLVVGATDVEYKHLLQRYHDLCDAVGPLPSPRVLNIDHGRQRFLLFALDGGPRTGTCTTPAMAWIEPKWERTGGPGNACGDLLVTGWAFKDGVGIGKIEVTVDGDVVATADDGLPAPEVAGFWRKWSGRGSSDPRHPDVGFKALLPAARVCGEARWIGLRLHGRDGSVEDWPERRVDSR